MSKKGETLLYGYNLSEERKFEVNLEAIVESINSDYGFDDNYFVFTSKEERDFNFNKNTGGAWVNKLYMDFQI